MTSRIVRPVHRRRGHAWIHEGQWFYSPNCTQPAPLPGTETFRPLTPLFSKASDFQEPQWWSESTEWMACVPRQPVAYSGIFFEILNVIPSYLMLRQDQQFILHPSIVEKWKNIEDVLSDAIESLAKLLPNRMWILEPFAPLAWKYDQPHPEYSFALEHIRESRDWFAMYIGLFYWLICKTPDTPKYMKGIEPERWFVHVICSIKNRKQSTWDAVRRTPMFMPEWEADRIGIWLHGSDAPSSSVNQPSVECSEDLQMVSTWIAPTPSSARADPSANQPVYGGIESGSVRHDDRPWSPVYVVPPESVEFEPPTETCVSTSAETPTQADTTAPTPASLPVTSLSGCLTLDEEANAAKRAWETWLDKHLEKHKRLEARWTEDKKKQRLDREKRKPRKRVPVNMWNWDDSRPRRYVPTPVLKSMHEETLENYRCSVVRWYDSYCDEWHCCNDWTVSGESFQVDSDSEDEDAAGVVEQSFPVSALNQRSEAIPSDPKTIQESQPKPAVEKDATMDDTTSLLAQNISRSSLGLLPSPSKNKSEELKLEQTQREVLRILMGFFGFVPPLPIPELINDNISDNDLRAALAILGLEKESISTSFFSTPLGKSCLLFLRSFASHENEKPSSEFWDLSTDNRQSLAYHHRLNAVRAMLSTRRKENEEEKDQEKEKKEAAAAMGKTDQKKKKAKGRKENIEKAEANRVKEAEEEEERKKRTWYLFDFGESSTVPWHLAIPSAAAALYVCRLLDAMTEEEIAQDLFEEDKQVSLLRGGYARRIALGSLAHNQAWRGPSGIYENPDHMFVARDPSGVEYVDDNLMRVEFEILSGVYSVATGKGEQAVKQLWYPFPWMFESSGEDVMRWTEHTEGLWNKRFKAILRDDVHRSLRDPITVDKWRDKLRGFPDTRWAMKKLELWSRSFLAEQLGAL
ncbi:hypothetical protein NP233_g11898 [Leucocoprinus birnbaumii]|uniref:Uncharacterized protein n=1 Tax=Leucocoprinus birnbaumii TaxID=56174 RepID=A0AAD5VFJ0_9AGAR|nr:hypothetical protein NP233_g11898 [Leucocoprinus birnbaumii]